jgi:hypothetical protein
MTPAAGLAPTAAALAGIISAIRSPLDAGQGGDVRLLGRMRL